MGATPYRTIFKYSGTVHATPPGVARTGARGRVTQSLASAAAGTWFQRGGAAIETTPSLATHAISRDGVAVAVAATGIWTQLRGDVAPGSVPAGEARARPSHWVAISIHSAAIETNFCHTVAVWTGPPGTTHTSPGRRGVTHAIRATGRATL